MRVRILTSAFNDLVNYSHVPQKTAFAQTEVDVAMLACALERYRLAEGRYPQDLNALTRVSSPFCRTTSSTGSR